MNESNEVGEDAEAEGFLRRIIRYLLEREIVTWDIGQRRRALRTARFRCYLGMMMIMVQVISHSVYKSYRGAEPISIDKIEKLWLAYGYYITLVWTLVMYLSMLYFTSVISGPSDHDMEWWWWRLDSRSLSFVKHLAPFWCLVVVGQMGVVLTYPIVYKPMLYNDFMNNIDEYYTSKEVKIFIDAIQENYICCGFHSYQDWVRLRRIRRRGQFPFTCCEQGYICDQSNVINYFLNYKNWYETEDYSVMRAKAPFKEKITSMLETMYSISDENLPIRHNGCAEKILKTHPFFWPIIFDMVQITIILRVMINIRRYSTGTFFACKAVQACPQDYTMLSATHACPRWTVLRPTKTALWRWQRDYLMQMYFYLLYQGKMKPTRYHDAIYPGRPFQVPDFEKDFDMNVRAYKSFLRYEIGKHKKLGKVRQTINPLFR